MHALVDRGQEAAAPAGIAAARPLLAGAEDDERRQVLRLRAETVGDPGAHARPAELHGPGVHQELAGSVIESVRDHRLHDRDVIGRFGQVRQ